MDFIMLALAILALKIYIKYAMRYNYDSYIHSAAWRRKRQLVLARDFYQCTQCHSTRSLQIHHLSYAHFGREKLYELTTLCGKCHKSRHKKY